MNTRAPHSYPSPEQPLYRQAQEWLRPALLVENAVAIDGTCGNGHDTLFLCEAAGGDRGVYGFDIQAGAIEATRKRLAAEGFSPVLQQLDHAQIGEYLDNRGIYSVQAAIFNLGYLPGGDHAVVTRPESTLGALRSIIGRCAPDFRLAVVAYRGHPGGCEEAKRVQDLLFHMDANRFSVLTTEASNRETGPILFRVQNHSRS